MKKTEDIKAKNMNTKIMNARLYLAVAIGVFLMAAVCIPGIASASPEFQKISQWPYGITHAVLGVNDTFFMASGASVWIFDVTDHLNPAKLSDVNFENPIYGFAAEGNYLYVANGKLGIVDISDLSNPVIMSICSDCSANDVKVRGDYAYVVGDGKLQVIDISDKSNPIKAGECDAGSKRLDISGDYAYVAAEASGLKIINISNPSNPTKGGEWAMPSGHRAFGVKVKGNYAYIADYAYGVWSIDVTDPTNPVDVSFAGGGFYAYEMDDLNIKGDYAYAACWYKGLIAIDISDPTSISIARQIPSTLGGKTLLGYNPGGVSISGNYAYMGGHYKGAGIYDISTPLSEELLKIVDAYGRCLGPIVVRDEYAYLTDDKGLLIMNVSDKYDPKLESQISLHGRSGSLLLKDNYAYVGATWAGLKIINISNPANPQIEGSYESWIEVGQFHNSYLHVTRAGHINEYIILDVSDHANVKEAAKYSFSARPWTVTIKDNYAFVGFIEKGGMKILDISDFGNITEVTLWLDEYNVYDIKIKGDYMHVRTDYELIIADISDPTNPVTVDSWGWAGQYYISGGPILYQNYLFMFGTSGIFIFDNSDPTNVSNNLLSIYTELSGSLHNIYFTEDDFGYVSAWEHGFHILKFYPEEDITPPEITNVAATAQIHSVAITWDTNEMADSLVKYGTSSGDYTIQVSDSSFGMSHSITLTELSGHTTYYYVVNSTDYAGNSNQSSEYSFTTLADVTPPTITIVNPENGTEFAGGTASVNVTITTDEPAWCQYSTSDFEYGEGSDFTGGKGTTEHSFVLNLKDGESYAYYYRCTDSAGNRNTVSTIHTFTTAANWWDYFDDESKIGTYENLVTSDGNVTLFLPENKVDLSKDCWLWSPFPDDNYNGYGRLEISSIGRTVIEFTMPEGAGEIDAVKLYLYKYGTDYEGFSHTINLHKLNGTFVENQVTWNSRSASEMWTNPGAEGDYDPTAIDHYDASGDTAEWYVWTIKGADADNSLDSLTWGDTVAFILEATGTRCDKFTSREGSSNMPYVEITTPGTLSGNLTSTPITPTSITSWDKFNATYSTPEGTSINFSILDAKTDGVLCSGLTGNGDDISGCLAGVSSIKLKAELATTDSSITPVLYDWGVNWNAGSPLVITDVTVTDITSNSATITWNTDEIADSLVKYGREPGNYTSEKYDSAYVVSHNVTLTNLLQNTTYYFVVNSTDASGNSAQSYEYKFTTVTRDITPPTTTVVITPVPNEKGWITATSATITFFRSDDFGVAYTNYSMASQEGPWTTVAGSEEFNVTLTDEGITTIWYYSADINGNVEDVKNTTVKIDYTAPIIANVTAAHTNSTTITWDTSELSDSSVKYGTAPGDYEFQKYDSSLVTSHTITLTDLVANTTYYCVVNSTDIAGNGMQSSEYNFTTLPLPDTKPPVISDVTATDITYNSATITWDTDKTADSVVKYGTAPEIYTGIASSSAYTTLHSIGLRGLTPDTAYYFVVNSTDISGNSAQSEEYKFTTSEGEEKGNLSIDISPDKDTYLWEEIPDYKYLSKTYLGAGNYTTGRGYTGLLEFTLPEAPNPGDKIVGMKLHLYYYDSLASGDDYLEAHELLEYVQSEADANWYSRGADNWSTAGALPPDSSSHAVIDSAFMNDTETYVWKTLVLKGEEAENTVNWNWGEAHGIMLTTQRAHITPGGPALRYDFVSKDATSSSPFTDADQYKPYLEIVYEEHEHGNDTDTTPPVISNVTVANITSSAAIIEWETDEPATSVLKYGTSPGSYEFQKYDAAFVLSHAITLTNLPADTTYYCVVNSTDIAGNRAQSEEFKFMTSEEEKESNLTIDISPDKDTYLWEEMPNYKYGTGTYLGAGNYTNGRGYTGLLEFTLPEAPNPGDKIVGMKLHLYYYDSLASGDDYLEAHELLEYVQSEADANWYSRGADNWSTTGALPPDSSSHTVMDSALIDDTETYVWKTLVLKGEEAEKPVNWNWSETHGIMLTTQRAYITPGGPALRYDFVSKDATSSSPFTDADQYKPYLEIVYEQ